VDCPGFNDSLLIEWFPYNNEIISFSSPNTTEVFHLQVAELSSPYEERQSTLSRSNACNAHKRINSTETTASEHKFYIELLSVLPAYARTPARSVQMSILGTRFYGTNLDENGFSSVSLNNSIARIENIPSLQLGNKTFSNVQKASLTDNLINGIIYQLYLSKGNGVIAYSIYPSTELFIKQ
jgi:hypothetical protein